MMNTRSKHSPPAKPVRPKPHSGQAHIGPITAAARKRDFRQPEHAQANAADYRRWHFSAYEYLLYTAAYLLLDACICYLFFRSWIPWFLFLPGIVVFMRERRKDLIRTRQNRLRTQFMTAMQLVSNALQAGYAPENAFREVLPGLVKVYGNDGMIVREFRLLTAGAALHVSAEKLLMDLGKRSGVDDIISFAEIFSAARRAGGDLITITSNTVSAIRQKQDTLREIETVLSGRAMEQKMMSLVPLFILGYVTLTSPGFFDRIYHNVTGIVIMSIALAVYAAAVLWGRSVMDIEI